jgi:hypothetical protein
VGGLQIVCLLAENLQESRRQKMGAKKKLNAANFMGAFLIAGILGLVTNSLAVFLLVGAALLAAGWMAGDIRA